jgi:hypothetical protein
MNVSAVRWFTFRRGLTLTVVLTLAVGVATVTTAFGVMHAALFRQPPFDDAGGMALLNLEPQRTG